MKTAAVSQAISSRIEGSEKENQSTILMRRYRGCASGLEGWIENKG